MAVQPDEGQEHAGRKQCWCCGTTGESDRMVHLGNHPEVALCLGCARWASKRAAAIEDRNRAGVGAQLRGRLREARQTVITQGGHRNRLAGRALRWLGRRLP